MRFNSYINEERVKLSPLLKSMFGKKDYPSDKREMEKLVPVINKTITTDMKANIAFATGGSNKGDHYVTVMVKGNKFGDIGAQLKNALEKVQWKVTKIQDKGNQGLWVYFTR